MSSNNIKKVYDALKSSGYTDMGNLEEFTSLMSDNNNRKLVYDALSQEGYSNLGDFDAFSNRMFGSVSEPTPDTTEVAESTNVAKQEIYEPIPVSATDDTTIRGFVPAFEQSADQLDAGIKYAVGEYAEKSSDYENAYNRMSELIDEGVDFSNFDVDKQVNEHKKRDYYKQLSEWQAEIAKREEDRKGMKGMDALKHRWNDPKRPTDPFDRRALATAERYTQEGIDKELDTKRTYTLIEQALKDADGDVEKAKALLDERRKQQTWGERMQEEAKQTFADARPTEGFGAWLGNLAPQMVGNTLAVAAMTNPYTRWLARPLGMANMAALTASSGGSSAYEARKYGEEKGVEIDDATARRAGLLSAGIEAATEYIPFENYYNVASAYTKKKLGNIINRDLVSSPRAQGELAKLVERASKELGGTLINGKNIKEWVVDAGLEGLSELMAEGGGALIPMIYQNEKDYPTLKSILVNGWEGAKAGMFMGAFLGGSSRVVNHYANRDRRKKAGHVDLAETTDGKIVEVLGFTGDDYSVMLPDGGVKHLKREELGDIVSIPFNEFNKETLSAETISAYEEGKSAEINQYYNVNVSAEEAFAVIEEKYPDMAEQAKSWVDASPSEVQRYLNDLPEDERVDIGAYLAAEMKRKGVIDGVKERTEAEVQSFSLQLEDKTDANGNVSTATYKDRQVFVKDVQGDNAVIMLDGKPTIVNSKDLSDIATQNVDEVVAEYSEQVSTKAAQETDFALNNHPKTHVLAMGETMNDVDGKTYKVVQINGSEGSLPEQMLYGVVECVYDDKTGMVQPKNGADVMQITYNDMLAIQNDYYLSMDADQAYANAMAEASNVSAETTENEGTPSEQIEQSVSEEVADGQIAETQPTEEVAESVAPATPQTARERVPKDEEGNPIYEQTDADTAWDAIVEETEGNVEMAQSVAEQMLANKKAALEELQEGKAKVGANVAQIIANEKKHQETISKAEADVKAWERISQVNAIRQQKAELERAAAEKAEAEQRRAEEIYAEDTDYQQEIATFADENQGTDAGLREDAAGVAEEEHGRAGSSVSAESDVDFTREEIENGEVVSEQEYKDGKRKVTDNAEDVRRTPLSELEYVKRETDRLFNEREDQSLSREEWELTDEGVDAENVAIDSYPSYIQSLSDSGELQRMFDLASVGEEIQIRRAVEAAGFELDDFVDTSVKRANAKAARDKKRAEKAKKLIESVTTNKGKQNGAKETIPEDGPRGRRSEKQGENQGDTRQSKSVIGRQIEEFELRTGWSRELSDAERLILEDVRKLTDSEIAALRNEAIESIERGEDVEDIEIVLNLLEKYGRSGERLYILSQSGIIPNQPVLLDKVEQLFMEYNEDEGLAILFDRLRPIIEQINPKITFEVIRDVDGNVKDSTVGDFYLKDNHLRFNLHSLNSSYQTDQEKASTIVHEMIHAITQYAIDANERGDKTLPKNVLEAAKSLVNIYNQIKDNEIFNTTQVDEEGNIIRDYGVKDVHEMISELANPEFRDKLKQIDVKGKNAWGRIIDAIARFINQFKDIYDTTAYGKAVRALDALMDNFNLDAYERSRALGSEAKESRVDNLRFREKEEPKDGKSLVGLHNISEEKLKKALKMGGLANPSMAVIDLETQGHTNFGDITLVAPSSLIDKKSGRNAGTFLADAWTPTYPAVKLRLDDKGWKKVKEYVDGVTDEPKLRADMRYGVEQYLNGYGAGYSNMQYAFLKENGVEIPIARKRNDGYISDEEFKALVGMGAQEASNGSMEAYQKFKELPQDVQNEVYIWAINHGNKAAIDKAKELIKSDERYAKLYENEVSFSQFNSLAYDTFRRERDNGEIDVNKTFREASDYVALNGLAEQFDKWLSSKLEEAGAKEMLFAGFSNMGNAKYVPNTLENASKLMKKEGKVNAYNDTGHGSTRAVLAEKVGTLEKIRKNKGKLQDEEAVKEAYEAFKDMHWSIIDKVHGQIRKSGNEFMDVDNAAKIVNYALASKNPIRELENDGYVVDEELGEMISDFVKYNKQMPVPYFETKFERPVYLNEFAAAVVPTGTSQEVMDALKQSGLEVVEYEQGNEEARTEAVRNITNEIENVRFRDGAPFFSNAERAVENIKQQKATPEQWLAMIKKDGGLKAGEDKWMGLSDWLNEQKEKGVKTLTKDEVLAFIRENQIEIEEVEYGSDVYPELQKMTDELKEEFENLQVVEGHSRDNSWNLMEEEYGSRFIDAFDYPSFRLKDEEAAMDLYYDKYGIDLGFQKRHINSTRLDYTTEGLDNKREIALVVPTIEPWNQTDTIHFGDAGDGRAVAWVRFGETTTPREEKYVREVKLGEPYKNFSGDNVYPSTESKKDYIVHKTLRDGTKKFVPQVNERPIGNTMETAAFDTLEEAKEAMSAYYKEHPLTKVVNERVLVIDEVQSKRHDEGRAKGYKSDYRTSYSVGEFIGEEGDKIANIYDSNGNKVTELHRGYASYYFATRPQAFDSIDEALDYLARNRGVPDAPFDKNYHELVMKRMLRYAAENGFDKVAWTKGKQQAQRYGLSTKVSEIAVRANNKGTYNVVIEDMNGSELMDYRGSGKEMTSEELSALVGKELSSKLIEGARRNQGLEWSGKGYNPEFYTIRGVDLSIGGEDRNALYDEMIPRFMNKYTKKWGTKVGEVTLPNVEEAGRTMWSVDVTPEMKESVMKGQPMFREGEGAVSDREVSYENDPIAKWQGKPRYYGKRAAAFAERERRRMENAAKEAAEMLGIEAEIITDTSTLQGRKAKAKGWYDISNKKVVVVVPNHVSMGDAVRTVLHEGVAHHGLRELFGDGFDAMLYNVYNNVAPELKARIDAIAERTGVSTSVATEEYLAGLAETTNFEEAQRRGWWAKIKQYFVKMLDKLGMPGLKLKEELTDNELRYLLWRSYKNLVEPNSYLRPLGYAEDVVKQKELKVGQYAEAQKEAPIAAETSEAEEWAAITMQRIEELEAQAAQLENEIAEMEAKRDADDASRYEIWEQQLEPLRKQMEDVYAELEGLYSLEAEAEEMSMASEDAIRYRLVDDPAEIERLESEPTIKAYRAMQIINGELYPPMSAVVDGKLREPIALGQWERSEEQPELADDNGLFKLDKGNKKSVPARYNPYFHSSATPLNDQFKEAQSRPNLVTVEVEIPLTEANGESGYKAEKAKDAVGTHQWKAGDIQGQLTGTRTLYLSRWDKPIRIVPDSEVAGVIAKMLEGTGIVMPSNVVTPSLRAELEKLGVPFVETNNQSVITEGEHKGEGYGKVYSKKADGLRYRSKDSARRQERNRINNNYENAVSLLFGIDKKKVREERIAREKKRREDAKEIYDSVLSGDFNDVTLQKINDYIDDATPQNPFGRRISQRLPQKLERGLHEGARTNAVDALFSRISESAVPANERISEAGRRKAEERKKELLKGWAIATGNWHTDLSAFVDDTTPIGEGTDSKVYLAKDGAHVIKASKGKPYGKRFRPDMDNIALFNRVFYNSRYEIVGYGEIDGEFVRILKQPIVDFTGTTPLTPDERVEYMKGLKFEPINDSKTAFSNGEIVISDLQKSNIIKDAAGNVRVIDADAKLHTKDVGGNYTYPPVEADLPQNEDSQENEDIAIEDSANIESRNDEEIIAEVERESAALGVPVRIARSVDELPDADTRKRAVDGKLKGYFDPRTNEVVLYAPNTDDANDAKRTILHEIVGHKGLRQLIGEKEYDAAMVRLMYLLPSDVRDAVLRRAEKHAWNAAIAMDEYLAEKAEQEVTMPWWGRVNAWMRAMFRKRGFDVKLTDADVKYLLWRSRKKLRGDDAYDMAFDNKLKRAARQSARAEAWVKDNFTWASSDSAVRERTKALSDMANAEYEEAVMSTQAKNMLSGIWYALKNGKKGFKSLRNDMAEAYLDGTRAVAEAQKAIEKKRGRKIRGYEDIHSAHNAKSSKDQREIFQLNDNILQPLSRAVANLINKAGKSFEEFSRYLNAKHGLERNVKFAERDAENESEKLRQNAVRSAEMIAKSRRERAEADYNDAVSNIDALRNEGRVSAVGYAAQSRKLKEQYDNKLAKIDTDFKAAIAQAEEDKKTKREELLKEYRKNDYSGLTAIFTMENEEKKPTIKELERRAQEYVDAFESSCDKNQLDLVWKLIRIATKFSVEKMYNSGLISKEQRDSMINNFEYYVPLRGWKDDYTGDVYSYIASGNPEAVQQVIKHAKGRKSEADNILGTIFSMANYAIVLGNKNEVNLKLLNLAYNDPSGLLNVEENWYEETESGELVPLFPDMSDENLTSEQKMQKIEEYRAKVERLKNEGKAKLVRNPFKERYPLHAKAWQEQQHAVMVKRGGEEFVVWVNGNPKLAQALNGLLHKSQREAEDNMMSNILRWMAATQTSYSPEFWLTNLQRDLITANTGNFIKYGAGYEKEFAKNLANLLPVTSFTGKKDKLSGVGIFKLFYLDNAGKLDMSNPVHKMFKEFADNGGMTGISQITDPLSYEKKMLNEIDKELSGIKSVPAEAVEAIGNGVEFINRGFENATRFATYMTSRQMGKGFTESIRDAKDVSVNFNMKGSGAWGNAFMRKYFIYFNAAIQGLRTVATWHEASKKRFYGVGGSVIAASVALAIINDLLSGGDDDDENAYYGLSEWNRYNFFNIKIGDNSFLHWSLPQEYRPIYALGQIGYDLVSGRISNDRALKAAIVQLNNLSPFSFVEDSKYTNPDDTFLEAIIKGLVPSQVKPLVDAYITNEDFLGRRVHGQTDFNRDLPEYKRVTETTPQFLIEGSRVLSEISGGRENKRGLLDNKFLTNPSITWYLLKAAGGGTITFLGKFANMSKWDEEWTEVPILPKFVATSGDDYSKQRVTNDKYWKYRRGYEEIHKELTRNKNDEDMSKERKKEIEESLKNGKKYEYYKVLKKYESKYKTYRELIEKYEEDGNAEKEQEYRDKLFELKKKIVTEIEGNN